MAWATPAYSRTKVDNAGFTYIDPTAPEEREIALTVINNWRSSHSFPLNTFPVNLREVAGRFDRDPTVAQRIKRLPSIRLKLERFPGMKLSRMQGLGGCRAVRRLRKGCDQLVDYYETESQIKHKLDREDAYILEPQASGYRGIHLVYSYYSDRKDYNGLKHRDSGAFRLRRASATAVETVGTFTQQALK